MFRHRPIPFGAVQVGAKAQRMQARIERAVSLGQHRIGGDEVEAVVNGAIDAVVARQVAPAVGLLQVALQGLEVVEVGVGDAGGGKLARQAFQRGHDLEGMAHVLA